VARLILAAVSPDNTPHGSNWTFAFPMLLFIVIGTLLYLRLSRPHRRVPPQPVSLPAAAHVPSADVARSASVAGGLSTAPGGGTTESHLEPGGAHLTAGGHVDPVDTAPAVAPEESASDPASSDPAGNPDGPEADE
jgi:hypothetical protein